MCIIIIINKNNKTMNKIIWKQQELHVARSAVAKEHHHPAPLDTLPLAEESRKCGQEYGGGVLQGSRWALAPAPPQSMLMPVMKIGGTGEPKHRRDGCWRTVSWAGNYCKTSIPTGIREVLSPLEYPSVTEWKSMVCNRCRKQELELSGIIS